MGIVFCTDVIFVLILVLIVYMQVLYNILIGALICITIKTGCLHCTRLKHFIAVFYF